jgi:hypothetical protein
MIARNKPPFCIGIGLNPGPTGQNYRNSVRVHVSYRAFLRARAFRPIPPAVRGEQVPQPRLGRFEPRRTCLSVCWPLASALRPPPGRRLRAGDVQRLELDAPIAEIGHGWVAPGWSDGTSVRLACNAVCIPLEQRSSDSLLRLDTLKVALPRPAAVLIAGSGLIFAGETDARNR